MELRGKEDPDSKAEYARLANWIFWGERKLWMNRVDESTKKVDEHVNGMKISGAAGTINRLVPESIGEDKLA